MKANRQLLLLLFCISFHQSFAQKRKLFLSTGTVETSYNIRQTALDSFNALSRGSDNRIFAIIQFHQIPDNSARKILAEEGITILDYIPDNAYTVSIRGDLQASILQAAGAFSLIQLSAWEKMETRLKSSLPAWSSKVNGTTDVWISFTKAYTQLEILSLLKNMNVEVLSMNMIAYRILALRISTDKLQQLASQPWVEFVQLAPRGDQTLNFNSRAASRANLLNAPANAGGKGLLGEGIVIGVGDNADVQSHVDFTGRLINRTYLPSAGHGQHVTGTVAGAGIGNDYFRGYAPKATIISQAFNGVLHNAVSYVNDYGMVITNNSYGDNVECIYHGTYDLYSRWMDQMAFDLPYLQNIFAAGNSGASTCAPFLPSFHTVLGGYQTAKNVLTVGATTDSGAIAGFSSKGPVKDGRTKPEITAMGQQVASAWPTSFYSYNNGTSMASPAVAGGAALLTERYKQLHGGSNPKNALMKAILCNGAMDRGANGPDFQYGFGWMNLLRSVTMIDSNWHFHSSVAPSAQNTHTIQIPSNTSQVKIMLYWNDPAASPLSSKALVNDLDLEVINGAQTMLPRINDTTNVNLPNASVEGIDRRNNMEQVIIANPTAGSYTIRVKGNGITQSSSQEYFIVYDIIPDDHLQITSPAGGETWIPSPNANGRMKISWEAYGFGSGTIRIEFSSDNGSNWSTLASNVDINRVIWSWFVPNISTAEARIRLTHETTGQTVISEQFSIMPIPVVTEAPVQCEGYFNINWTTVTGATDYEVMILRGDEMQTVAFTTGTNYSFGGLSTDTTYWVTVKPRINGIPGRRANAISRTPVGGNCSGSISDNDLKLEAVLTPFSGRMFTALQKTASEPVTIRIKNLDDVPQSNFEVKYAVNGGPFVAETITISIAPGATYTHTFTTPVDLSIPDNYYFVFIVKNNNNDPVSSNDTIYKLIRHVENLPLNLNSFFIDDMETADEAIYMHDTVALLGLNRYDFSNSTAFGRLRTFLNSGMAFSGNNAITMDVDRYLPSGNTNYLYGTYNLVNYNAANHDIRLDFVFNNHGQQPHPSNHVWIRGSDADLWIPVYDLSADQDDPGNYKKSVSIEVSDFLIANGQNFTTSFGVRFGQWGQLAATDKNFAGGYSFDDIRIYQVFNDLQMESIDEPVVSSCALTNSTVVKVTVKNASNATLTNIPVRYRIDGGPWTIESIPAIPGNGFVQYSFAANADLSSLGSHTVQAVVDYSGDSFRENDTLTVVVVNSPVVSNFPHLQNFESGNGFYYSGGKKSSWEYGNPSSVKVKSAASGAFAWKTRLAGHYNNNEYSYLYSPCYDISNLANPMLSFSIALDIEDCGTSLCDGAWVEYSADGETWNKLGNAGEGTNWYNKATDQLWSIQNYTNWHVATIALPQGLNRLRLRFVMNSDAGVNREGIAIDDIHIYDSIYGIYDGPTTLPVNRNVSGNNLIDFLSNNKIIASIQAKDQNLGSTEAQAYIHQGTVRSANAQYYLDRNITIKPANEPGDSVLIRYYFLDREVDSLLKASGCNSCGKPSSAYELGVSVYSDPDPSFENGTLGDNNQGVWKYLSSDSISIIPFDKGYYAEFKVNSFSEFWLNAGGLDGSTPLPVKLMDFKAAKNGNDVILTWKVGAETNVDRYEIELARGNEALQLGNWAKIGETLSLGNSTTTRTYNFLDTESNKLGARHYRLKTVNDDGSFVYSPVRSVMFDEAKLWQIYPNPSGGIFQFLFQIGTNETMGARIFDTKGRLIAEYIETGTGQVQKVNMDISAQATGVYFLEVDAGGKKQQFKIFKH